MLQGLLFLPGMPNPSSMGCMWLRIAVNVAQHKIINLLKTFFFSSFFIIICVFNVWPKTTFLLPMWPRVAKSLDTPARMQGILYLPKPHFSHLLHRLIKFWSLGELPALIICAIMEAGGTKNIDFRRK